MTNTNWETVLLDIFKLDGSGRHDPDLYEDLKNGKHDRLADAKGELTSDGFQITYDYGTRSVRIRLVQGTVFRCYCSPGINDSSMILPQSQNEARQMFDSIVDRLLAD